MKYELTSNTLQVGTSTLYQIRAVEGTTTIQPGTLGGYIQSPDNLDQKGNAWVSENAWVYGDAEVCGNARV